MASIQPPFPPQPPPPPPYPPYYPQRRRSRWWIPLVVIGVLLVILIGGIFAFIAIVGSSFKTKPITVQSHSVLYINFADIQEQQQDSPLRLFGNTSEDKVSLLQAIQALKYAKSDDKIQGVYFRARGAGYGLAIAQELQNALVDFKKSGKFMYAFIETGSKLDYFNALPADSIFMPREGLLEFNSFSASSLFFKGLFDKIGVDWHVEQFEEYKSFAETFNRTKFSDPAREELRGLIDQRTRIYIDNIARLRSVDRSVVSAALDRGVYEADSLHALRLIDAVMGEGAVRELIRKRTGLHEEKKTKDEDDEETADENLRLVRLNKYVRSNSFKRANTATGNEKIALIYGSGGITTGKNSNNPFSEERSIASESFISDLRDAREDDDIDAILIRINSPGGSVIASDAIWEEIQKTRKVKPVYASMSDVAASGGYYIAMACDTIIAHPATITGSIGVILTIPNFSKSMDKLGITVDTVTSGQSALFMNPTLPFSERDKQKLYQTSRAIYMRFLEKVAQSRHKSVEEIRTVARGRVWTGEAAAQNGLVDIQGGLQDALNVLKKRIGVDPDRRVQLEIYPKPDDEISSILKMFGIDHDEDESKVRETALGTAAKAYLGANPSEFLQLWMTLPAPVRTQMAYALQLARTSEKEKVQMSLPYLFMIE